MGKLFITENLNFCYAIFRSLHWAQENMACALTTSNSHVTFDLKGILFTLHVCLYGGITNS